MSGLNIQPSKRLSARAETTFAALLAKQTSFTAPLHFDSKGRVLAICHDLDHRTAPGQSRAEALLASLRQQLPDRLPERLYLATTVGAIDLLEKDGNPIETSRALLDCAKRLFGARQAWLVAAACASGQVAITSVTAIRAGNAPTRTVVGCDIASEFVTAGFASLGALAATTPRPYSQDRDGMTLGEAAAAVVLTARPKQPCGRITAWGETCDAAHITAPDRAGTWLGRACQTALAGRTPAAIIGHGTGTVYNDDAELAALTSLMPTLPPLFSLKANLGHTMGATGVIQAIIATAILRRQHAGGLAIPDPRAAQTVSASPPPFETRHTPSMPALAASTHPAGRGASQASSASHHHHNSGQRLRGRHGVLLHGTGGSPRQDHQPARMSCLRLKRLPAGPMSSALSSPLSSRHRLEPSEADATALLGWNGDECAAENALFNRTM